MVWTLISIVLAAFGLGILIFIHEYGHYWMARKEGMTIEVFSIGFGKPIHTWERHGVRWQLCWLPFGGYVRIAGMDKRGALEPYQIPDGFYGKTPLSRIRVALTGPCVNILFAFAAFCALWLLGGRQKPFSDYTHILGGVDKDSGLYAAGVRPGDRIEKINQTPFRGFQDFLYAAVLQEDPPVIEGQTIDYLKQETAPFSYAFTYPTSLPVAERVQAVLSAVHPASYLIYNQQMSLSLDQDSPMKDSGIEEGDRLVWVDGELIFSRDQLVSTINEPRALLTVKRGERTFLARVPRVKVGDLRLNVQQKGELEDWQNEAKLKGRLPELFFIPYNVTNQGIVEHVLSYLNEKTEEQRPTATSRAPLEVPLQEGDQIIALDGMPLSTSPDLLRLLQTRHLQVIVKKQAKTASVSWRDADRAFVSEIDWIALGHMIQTIGTASVKDRVGQLQLLRPVEPRPLRELPLTATKRASLEQALEAQKKQIEEMKDEQQRALALQQFEREQNQLKLGIVMTDLQVNYNPSPFALFGSVFQETWKTLVALFTGSLTPKHMTGPVGIVQVMQQSWGHGFKEALFWLGMISLNLGMLNLLPIPVLDGGHICFSLWEKLTGRPIKARTMERLIIPFVVLLIALFLYLTYNDLMRIFSGLFR